MTTRVTRQQVDTAKLLLALDKAAGRASDPWVLRVANAVEPAGTATTAPRVTRDQVDTAKLLLAIERADGRPSDEWTIRVANAAEPPRPL